MAQAKLAAELAVPAVQRAELEARGRGAVLVAVALGQRVVLGRDVLVVDLRRGDARAVSRQSARAHNCIRPRSAPWGTR